MTALLRKFRISYSDVIEVSGVNKRPLKDRFVMCLTSYFIILLFTVLIAT